MSETEIDITYYPRSYSEKTADFLIDTIIKNYDKVPKLDQGVKEIIENVQNLVRINWEQGGDKDTLTLITDNYCHDAGLTTLDGRLAMRLAHSMYMGLTEN